MIESSLGARSNTLNTAVVSVENSEGRRAKMMMMHANSSGSLTKVSSRSTRSLLKSSGSTETTSPAKKSASKPLKKNQEDGMYPVKLQKSSTKVVESSARSNNNNDDEKYESDNSYEDGEDDEEEESVAIRAKSTKSKKTATKSVKKEKKGTTKKTSTTKKSSKSRDNTKEEDEENAGSRGAKVKTGKSQVSSLDDSCHRDSKALKRKGLNPQPSQRSMNVMRKRYLDFVPVRRTFALKYQVPSIQQLNAAITIQSAARRMNRRVKYSLLQLERKAAAVELQKKRELTQIREDVIRKQLACREKLKQKKQQIQQELEQRESEALDSQKQADALRTENAEIRDKNMRLMKNCKNLKINNTRLTKTIDSYQGDYFASLKYHTERVEEEHKRLVKLEQQMKEQIEETEADLVKKTLLGRMEHFHRQAYERFIWATIDRIVESRKADSIQHLVGEMHDLLQTYCDGKRPGAPHFSFDSSSLHKDDDDDDACGRVSDSDDDTFASEKLFVDKSKKKQTAANKKTTTTKAGTAKTKKALGDNKKTDTGVPAKKGIGTKQDGKKKNASPTASPTKKKAICKKAIAEPEKPTAKKVNQATNQAATKVAAKAKKKVVSSSSSSSSSSSGSSSSSFSDSASDRDDSDSDSDSDQGFNSDSSSSSSSYSDDSRDRNSDDDRDERSTDSNAQDRSKNTKAAKSAPPQVAAKKDEVAAGTKTKMNRKKSFSESGESASSCDSDSDNHTSASGKADETIWISDDDYSSSSGSEDSDQDDDNSSRDSRSCGGLKSLGSRCSSAEGVFEDNESEIDASNRDRPRKTNAKTGDRKDDAYSSMSESDRDERGSRRAAGKGQKAGSKQNGNNGIMSILSDSDSYNSGFDSATDSDSENVTGKQQRQPMQQQQQQQRPSNPKQLNHQTASFSTSSDNSADIMVQSIASASMWLSDRKSNLRRSPSQKK